MIRLCKACIHSFGCFRKMCSVSIAAIARAPKKTRVFTYFRQYRGVALLCGQFVVVRATTLNQHRNTFPTSVFATKLNDGKQDCCCSFAIVLFVIFFSVIVFVRCEHFLNTFAAA